MKRSLFLCTGLGLALLVSGCGSSHNNVVTPPPVTPTTPLSDACKAAIGFSGAPTSAFVAQSLPSAALPTVTSSTPNWSAPHVAGEVLVSDNGNLSAQAATKLSGLALTPVGNGLQRAKTPSNLTDQAFAKQLRAAGLNAQPNFIYHALALPNDPGFPGNAGIKVENVNAFQNYLSRIRVPQAWATLRTCGLSPAGALTALVDSPVEALHDDLRGQINVGVQLTAAGADKSHGTAGAGIIGANTNNGVGLSGIVWNAQLLSEEVLSDDTGTTADIAKGINDAVKKGAKVINLSLGEPDVTGDAILDKVITAAEQSAVVVVAAGNSARDGVYYPANLPGVIAVGSVGASDSVLACYSARPISTLPRQLDIVAPSGVGYGACDNVSRDQDMLLLNSGNTYMLNAGTSFAAPQVSAVAALMRAANPKLTAAQTRSLLIGSVNSASGLPLLDADAAVKAALRAN